MGSIITFKPASHNPNPRSQSFTSTRLSCGSSGGSIYEYTYIWAGFKIKLTGNGGGLGEGGGLGGGGGDGGGGDGGGGGEGGGDGGG